MLDPETVYIVHYQEGASGGVVAGWCHHVTINGDAGPSGFWRITEDSDSNRVIYVNPRWITSVFARRGS